MEHSHAACVRGPIMGTLPSCQASSKNVQVLDQSLGAAINSSQPLYVYAPGRRCKCGMEMESLGLCRRFRRLADSLVANRAVNGFFQCDRKVLDERLEKHAGRIDGKNDDVLSLQRETFPFRVGLVERAILFQGAKIGEEAGKRLGNVVLAG